MNLCFRVVKHTEHYIGYFTAVFPVAQSAGIPVALIQDAGRTVVSEGTVTCVGIGPATAAQLEPLTGELKLL